MMFGLSKIAAVGAMAGLLGVLALGGYALWLSDKLSEAETEAAELRGQLAQCSGRIQNIMEDRADDATVDDPDFTVPCEWMLGGCDTAE